MSESFMPIDNSMYAFVLHRKVICVVLSEPLRPHCKLQPHRRRRRRPTKRQDSVLVVILSEIIQIDDSL